MSVFTYKSFNGERDKLLLKIVAVFLALYFAFGISFFSASAESVRESVVRLHVLANSDSQVDQAVKLRVRDALLKTNAEILSNGVTVENAEKYFEASKKELLETVLRTLEDNGFYYGAHITLQKEYYETRKYGDLIFPAGKYTSLKVVLGDGAGKNWWCVMFPPLCIPVADDVRGDKEKTAEYLSPSGEKIVNGGEKYIVRFKLLEIYEELRERLGV